ncbi:MAG: hypothetical protein P8O05_04260 [Flavobacteriales bacterium]|nr:hypothetical protein [Flavobacteriales bacterium]
MFKLNLEKYDAAVACLDGIQRKGKTVPYTSANGYMFSFINKEGQFGVRLPKEAYLSFREEHNDADFRSHGSVMKEYVHVPDSLMENQEVLKNLISSAHQYVISLPPK